MRKRNFIVIEHNKEYVLKEIDTTIAKAMNIFGVAKGEYTEEDESNSFFYFCSVNPNQANEMAAKLSREYLEGRN